MTTAGVKYSYLRLFPFSWEPVPFFVNIAFTARGIMGRHRVDRVIHSMGQALFIGQGFPDREPCGLFGRKEARGKGKDDNHTQPEHEGIGRKGKVKGRPQKNQAEDVAYILAQGY